MIHTLPRLDVTRLAADFSAAVRGAHSAAELASIRQRNAAERQPGIDHVHDFTDANDLMAEAMACQVTGWNWNEHADEIETAWQRAKAAQFKLSRVLVACEWSGTVRDAFTARGHDATSCDLLATDSPGKHYRGDVRDIMGDGYHLMLSFPPCTYLASCQLWRCQPKHDKDYPARQHKSDEALEFVRDLNAAPIRRKVLENPRGRIGSAIRPADQEIHPYQFGHDVSKTTGLWFDGMDKLPIPPRDQWIAPRIITYKGKQVKRWGNQSPCGADKMGPCSDRGHKRGKTYSGIAEALADHCGGIARAIMPAPRGEVLQLALF